MKQSILRVICASLLMLMALGVTVGIFATPQEDETVYVWQSIKIASEQEVRLYNDRGELVQTLAPHDGGATSKLLIAGRYYAVSGELRADFTVESDDIIVHNGGWTDGRVLHVTDEKVGTICVEFAAEDAFYKFSLQGTNDTRCEIVRGYKGETGKCEFFGLPFGEYVLFLDEAKISAVKISEQMPTLIVAIP